jgi:glycosyltransferase involved in cell wall biosynthesis
MISVIVCTIGRKSLYQTIRSIRANSYKDYEILVISQLVEIDQKYLKDDKRIRYYHIKSKGLSQARNFGIQQARGDIICFTDDDCIADKTWLQQIYVTFKKNKGIVGIFGNTLSYKPENNKNKRCPCIFEIHKSILHKEPCYHSQVIGFGNNMAFKKKVFPYYGSFKNWLGVNAIGSSAEDAEFVLRLLIKGQTIISSNDVVVYHNRWLTVKEWDKQLRQYMCGEMACYGYLAFKGHRFARQIIFMNIRNSFYSCKHLLKQMCMSKASFPYDAFQHISIELYKIKGICVALYFSQTE